MFVRVKKTPNSPRRSVQIVMNLRQGHKTVQQIVEHIGIAKDELEEQKLKRLGYERIAQLQKKEGQQSLFKEQDIEEIANQSERQELEKRQGRLPKKKLEDVLPMSQVTIDQIIEEGRINEGVDEIGSTIYNQLGYDSLDLPRRAHAMLKDIVLSRLIYPHSKHKIQKTLAEHFGKEYDLDAIYRLMDQLHSQIPTIKSLTFEKTRSLMPEQTAIVLFDVTTLYFETVETDELRQLGYSKDNKANQAQVVLALATNEDGLPIGYELFKGNKAEVSTLCESIDEWKKFLTIEKVCFIGDRAMFSDKNLTALEKLGYTYIVAAKLRALPAELQEQILAKDTYKPALLGKKKGLIAEFIHKERRLVVSFKEERALADAKKRTKQVQSIEKKLAASKKPENLLSNKAIKKFTTTSVGATISISAEKIQQEVPWDGLHGVITNIKELDACSVIAHYGRLWVIEDGFRVNKHNLEMRPIYHWKSQRIEAHIAMCYMTFSVLRHLQYKVGLTQKLSVNDILEGLLSVQASIIVYKPTGDRYRIPSRVTHNASKIYKAFGMVRSPDAEPYVS